MSEEEKCDLSYCNNKGGHYLTKYIQLCEDHWFRIMNRLETIPYSEEKKLEELERKRLGR